MFLNWSPHPQLILNTAQMNNVQNNVIIANYGASQGFDTDDGSSWCVSKRLRIANCETLLSYAPLALAR